MTQRLLSGDATALALGVRDLTFAAPDERREPSACGLTRDAPDEAGGERTGGARSGTMDGVMFKLDSEAALLKAFRPKDRPHVEVSPDFTFPLAVHDYVAWRHPGGGRVFLVFATHGGAPTGIAFDTNGGSSAAPQMCSWCHSSVAGTGVGLLTATLNSNKRIGVMVCSDLSCAQKLEEQANLGGYSPRPAMEKLVERMGRFASDALHIDLSGAGR